MRKANLLQSGELKYLSKVIVVCGLYQGFSNVIAIWRADPDNNTSLINYTTTVKYTRVL